MMFNLRSHIVLGLIILLASCGGDDESPLFSSSYLETYVEVRNCRPSGDHDLNNIRILADPAALGPYNNRDQNFPLGSIVLKEEFEFDDSDCSGPVKQWTVMQRLADGDSPEALDWEWQKVDADSKVVSMDPLGCARCHSGCGSLPEGFDGTCAVP